MEGRLLPDGATLEVTTPEGRRFTFPTVELQATRRPPRVEDRASGLPVPSPLQMVEDARQAAQEFAILNDII